MGSKLHGVVRSGQDKWSRPAVTTPKDKLGSEGYSEVKMKGEEDLVKVREAVPAAINNLQEEVASTLPGMLWLPYARTRQQRTGWLRWLQATAVSCSRQ